VNGIDPSGKFLISLGIGILNSTLLRNSDTKLSIGTLRVFHQMLPYLAKTYDFMFSLLALSSLTGTAITYYGQGTLAGKVAAFYCIRGLVGATGIGLVYTHLSQGDMHNGWEFSDDGTVSQKIMEKDFRRKRYNWLLEFAENHPATASVEGWKRITIDDYTMTGLKFGFDMTENFWIGGIHGMKVRGSFETNVNTGAIRNLNLVWLQWDDIDTNPDIEAPFPMYCAETIVGYIGDGLLGANYAYYIRCPEIIEGLASFD
jgi:hypothetical protein